MLSQRGPWPLRMAVLLSIGAHIALLLLLLKTEFMAGSPAPGRSQRFVEVTLSPVQTLQPTPDLEIPDDDNLLPSQEEVAEAPAAADRSNFEAENLSPPEAAGNSGSEQPVPPSGTETSGENTDDTPSDADQLKAAVNTYISRHRENLGEQWMQECRHRQYRQWQHDCSEDPDFQDTNLQRYEALGDAIFAAVKREDIKDIESRNRRKQNVLLETIAGDSEGLVNELASSRMRINNEVVAYLGRNYDEVYWNFLRFAFSADPQIAYAREWSAPRCHPGPCVFELTDYGIGHTERGGEESISESVPFRLTPQLFPGGSRKKPSD